MNNQDDRRAVVLEEILYHRLTDWLEENWSTLKEGGMPALRQLSSAILADLAEADRAEPLRPGKTWVQFDSRTAPAVEEVYTEILDEPGPSTQP